MQEQLANALNREQRLLAMITTKPEPVVTNQVIAPQPINTTKTIPWHIKRSLLEAEDRAKAAALRSVAEQETKTNNKPVTEIKVDEISIEKLEKELAIGEGA